VKIKFIIPTYYLLLIALIIILSNISINAFTQDSLGTIKDIIGNEYKTIKIGSQIWMAENLATTKFSNGDPIQLLTDWSYLHYAAFCYYGNNFFKYGKIGVFYNWYAVDDERNICPTGWHVPTRDEWWILITYLGNNNRGGKLKSTGTTIWKSPNTGATNETGFSALPGGIRDHNEFDGIGEYGQWWSATEDYIQKDRAWRYIISFDEAEITELMLPKDFGINVRCLKD
jgi:uncharacterized protein (TIGR02145 family)